MKRRDLLAIAGGTGTTLLAGPASAAGDEETPTTDADDEDADTIEIDVLIG